ncbi:MAG: polysaccharide pyruvyl transferase family protein [Lachnospiraceae bacterium]|nr:polysaccharide pyruvyl transferase family protein [Lachnospiraceae bacterium]
MSKKLRVGILTEYYNSVNYGGNLQAYALVHYLAEHGVYAEQISYDKSQNYKFSLKERLCKYSLLGFMKKLGQKIFLESINNIVVKIGTKCHMIEMRKIEERNKIISEFNQKIPHSKKIFNDTTMHECNKIYDVFITGSDQVWNLMTQKSYFLTFTKKPKYSYAASISKDSLEHNEIKFFKYVLKNYKGISVREKETAKMLATLTGKNVEWVADPVFLLSVDKWKKLSTLRIIKEPYIFCYFLGDAKWHRRVAMSYAKKKNTKIVTLPYLLGKYRLCDANFGTERLFEIKPEDFISLVRYAETVITDSFHATAFSVIFERNFFVFERPAQFSMGSRIRSLMDITGIEKRYYMTEKEASYYMLYSDIDDRKIDKKSLEAFIKKSKIFLENII